MLPAPSGALLVQKINKNDDNMLYLIIFLTKFKWSGRMYMLKDDVRGNTQTYAMGDGVKTEI